MRLLRSSRKPGLPRNDIFRQFRHPSLTIDIIIKYQHGVILVERKNPPLGWALPGGFVNYGETVEAAARREAREETGLRLKNLRQFRVYSDPNRDPRGHTVSVAFIAEGSGMAKAASDAKSIRVFTKNNLPKNIAFDHRKILKDYFSDL